jgi:hypothetical protein
LHMFTITGYNLIERKKERYASIKLLLPTLPWYMRCPPLISPSSPLPLPLCASMN